MIVKCHGNVEKVLHMKLLVHIMIKEFINVVVVFGLVSDMHDV